jgi:hypothetical protein
MGGNSKQSVDSHVVTILALWRKKNTGFSHCIMSALPRCYNHIDCKSWHLPLSTWCIDLATKSLHPSLSGYLHYSYPNNMAKSMTKVLQNSTHVSKQKWANPKLSAIMETKDKTLFVPALSICYHHINLAFKCSCIWKFF